MTNDIHDTLQALLARMEALEARSAAPPVVLDGSSADEDDTMLPTCHIVKRPIASDLTPFHKLIKAIPGMEHDFFRQPLDEASRHRFLLNCPRNVLRQYQAPVLNYSGVGPHTKHTDAQLADIQFCLSGLTRPIDLFAHDVLVEGSIQITQALDGNLPITPIVTNSALEPKPLLNSQQIVEQSKLQHFCYHSPILPAIFPSPRLEEGFSQSPTAVQVSDNQYTTVGERLQLHSSPIWHTGYQSFQNLKWYLQPCLVDYHFKFFHIGYLYSILAKFPRKMSPNILNKIKIWALGSPKIKAIY
ncbi:hypothetical protein PHYBLDRAFT_146773 [Phycomyces blakesleeanus NRRL 1555(-)]|uniref:Uncharacterized protein n=1 Tax=Phycomyces blakesleeanus (strain ATCC 8743b / DSM 1359 / FGSC 10004 / NBRC 33097 / NRRL 1555) TaxID=763407 RepID=A0A162X5J4_PHYB8|nr:hypothetical protein PHYBLDRAFT_146773 [Phycomyces blakesleeanus NRRL 1555(-)]OAD72585.1 hypothetical protein PHYBLDRAFT_146773 [Phycomyces blakesleeanus NRRL 1555(-)]|eukprot:XP_018290625.1 hypothetical protein PHYBLDRAFT_146773 [Phycomyces blakesleeanus NRRL 1555(-)]